ncbi:hypothetical protein ACET3X_000005 [Alternaria dauci]|uniref:Uncharacterized protein n=1 Tax=Alternaria dauci TaxID=48095 RepID=A0ABR3UUB3_9PLEO
MYGQNLPRPFLIEINGKFVANPDPAQMNETSDGRVPAVMGDRGNAAVFEFRDGSLRKTGGPDALHFGRHRIEPMAFMPMPVFWIAQREMAQECMFEGDEESPTGFKCAGYSINWAPGQGDWIRAFPPEMGLDTRMKLHWQ